LLSYSLSFTIIVDFVPAVRPISMIPFNCSMNETTIF
jgi:hypothetical protein